MRRALEMLVRWLAEALIRLYYPHRSVDGADRIPATGRAVIFVANHPNGLLDPLLLRVATGRAVRFLAKSTLFRNPIARLAMTAFGSIPVYRAHESGARGQDTSRNEESFARCRSALAHHQALALFPEGVSHSDPQLRPLKTGAARIALSAQAEQDAAGDLTVVPIGLYYERKVLFRSRVLLVVGEPLRIAPLLPAYRADQRAAVDALTDDIRARLDDVVLQAESRELLAGVARVARWTGAPATADDQGAEAGADRDDDLAAQHRHARDLLGAYGRLRAREPQRVEAIAAQARAYERILRHLGVRDPWALEVELVAPLTAALSVLRLLVAFPVAIAGAVLGYLPYRLAGEVAKRVTRDEDVLGTVKLLGGTLFLWLGWSAEAIAAGVWWGARWIVPVFLFAVASGYVALRFNELRAETAEALRHLWLRLRHRDTAQALATRRRALVEAVTAGLKDAG